MDAIVTFENPSVFYRVLIRQFVRLTAQPCGNTLPEHMVPGPIEQRVEPGAIPDPPSVAAAPPDAMPRYRLATDVPSNWTPLLPQRA
ncbi:MAG: hypothetical protein ACREV2_07165, partial [Burkholderiales bacterium]